MTLFSVGLWFKRKGDMGVGIARIFYEGAGFRGSSKAAEQDPGHW